MFRPEMLLPMNLPEDVSVIAWGLSLERYIARNSRKLPCIVLSITPQ